MILYDWDFEIGYAVYSMLILTLYYSFVFYKHYRNKTILKSFSFPLGMVKHGFMVSKGRQIYIHFVRVYISITKSDLTY